MNINNNKDRIKEIESLGVSGEETPLTPPDGIVGAINELREEECSLPDPLFVGKLVNPLIMKDKPGYAKKMKARKHITFKPNEDGLDLLECYYNDFYIELYTRDYNEHLQAIPKKNLEKLARVDKKFQTYLEETEYTFYENISELFDLFGDTIYEWGMATPSVDSSVIFTKAVLTEAVLRNMPVYPDLMNEQQRRILRRLFISIKDEYKMVYHSEMTKEVRTTHYICGKNYYESMSKNKSYLLSSGY